MKRSGRPVVVHFFGLSPVYIVSIIDLMLAIGEKFKGIGYSPIFMIFSSQFDRQLKTTLGNSGIGLEIIPSRCTKGLKLVLFLFRFIRRNKVDIFSFQFGSPFHLSLVIILTKIIFLKTVFIYHQRLYVKKDISRFNPKKFINHLSILGLLVDRIVCVSNAVRNACIQRGVRARKLMVIHNGINIAKFELAQDQGKIRRELRIPSDFCIITCIKHASPGMGIDYFIRAIPEVLSRFPKTIFLIVGGGKETNRLKEIVYKLRISERVIFLGPREDIADILAQTYISVNPCPVEAFGMTIVESMAAAKPVIAINQWGPKEIVVHGKTGVLVDYGDTQKLSSSMLQLLRDDAKAKLMGQEANAWVRGRFDLDFVAKQIADVYSDILRQKNAKWSMIALRYKGLAKRVLSNLFFYTKIFHFVSPTRFRSDENQQWMILSYHRVTAPDQDSNAARWQLKGIPPREFERDIRYLKKNFTCISLSKGISLLRQRRNLPKKSITITFDDGYKDIYDNAFPILKKYNVPATIFLITGYIDSSIPQWRTALNTYIRLTEKKIISLKSCEEYINNLINIGSLKFYSGANTVNRNPEKILQRILTTFDPIQIEQLFEIYFRGTDRSDCRHFNLTSEEEKKRTAERLSEILSSLNATKRELILEILKIKLDLQGKIYAPFGEMLTWEMVREMKENNIDFGVHTAHHPILTRISLDNVKNEVSDSKKGMQDFLSTKITLFCYPNGLKGDFNDETKEILSDLGFEGACTSVYGVNTNRLDCMQLKRIFAENLSLPELVMKMHHIFK